MKPVPGTEPALAELRGLWTRSLIQWPDGRRDVSTAVHWLQGPSLYIDLRQPVARPDFSTTRALEEVTDAQLAWLVNQEGFAGRLGHTPGWFEWAREIDFQPQAMYSDCGSLRHADGYLVETGRDVAYVEHWHRAEIGDVAQCAAARLLEADSGRTASLVRVGEVFMLAVDRSCPLPALPTLAACVAAAPDRRAALALVDFELSFGRIVGGQWRITQSSLPWREARLLAPRRVDSHGLELGDGRRFTLVDCEGEPSLLGG